MTCCWDEAQECEQLWHKRNILKFHISERTSPEMPTNNRTDNEADEEYYSQK